MKRFVPSGDEIQARSYVQQLRNGEYDQIEPYLDPSVANSSTHETLIKMAAVFPKEDPISVKVVGSHWNRGTESSTSDITLEYQFPDKWLLVGVATQTTGDVRIITNLRVVPIADSLENLNKFTFVGKSAAHYLVLAIACASLIFSLCVFVVAVRSKHVKFKWLWAIFTLVGVSRFAINWSTGEASYMLLAVQIPCFSASHPLYAPWIIGAYFPLGAVLFLNQRWLMRIRGESVAPPPRAPENVTAIGS